MKYPNKLIPYNKSTIRLFPILLAEIKNEPIPVIELYRKVQTSFVSVTEYIEALDCLFSLGHIDYNSKIRRLYYVVRSNL